MEKLVYVGKNKKDTSKKKIRLSEKAQRVYGALALASMLVVGKVAFENISFSFKDVLIIKSHADISTARDF